MQHPVFSLRPIIHTLRAAALGIVFTGTLTAMATSAAEVAVRNYQIPASSLDVALKKFAASSGLNLSVDTSQTRGLNSAGLQGSYSAETALAQLLAGTNLEAVNSSDGNYLVRAKLTSLRTVKVSSDYNGVTEETGSYTATGPSSTATGLNLSLRDTPQAVSVISRQRLDDQNLTSLNQVMKAIPGISVQANGVGSDDLRFHARGYPVENMMLDGTPVRFDGFSAVSPDTLMYDRIEVVRGATGLTSGTGNPSAAINLVRKRPVADPLLKLGASVGNWDRYSLTADTSSALGASGKVRGRLAGRWQEQGSFVDVVDVESNTLYGIVEADLTSSSVLGVGGSWQRNETDGLMWGLPADRYGNLLDYPRSTFWGAPWAYTNREGESAFIELRQMLGDEWMLKAEVLHLANEADYISPHYWRNATWDKEYAVTQITGNRSKLEEVTAHLSLTGTVDAFGRNHDLSFSLNDRQRDSDGSGAFTGNLQQTGMMSVLDPTGIRNLPLPAAIIFTKNAPTEVHEQTLAASGRFRLTDRVSTILGSSLTWFEQDSGTTSYDLSNEWTPYAGLLVDIDEHHTAYASYTQILQPQYAINAAGNLLDPITGTNLETGIKGEYFEGRLNSSLSVFRMRQRDRAMPDEQGPSPCPATGSTFCSRAAGEVESKGVDVELSGSLATSLEVALGYTFTESEYLKDANLNNVGKPFNTRLPKHQYKLFSNWHLPGAWQRWNIGLSAYHQTKMYNGTIQQEGYWTAGLLAGYKASDNISLRLNVENLFDKRYYEALGYVRSTYSSNNWYGAPRNATLSLDVKF